MKKSFKRYLSLVMVLMIAFVCLFGVSVSAATDVATFEFGANGAATHSDGSDAGATKSYTEGSYTLALTGMSKVYANARDALGNSCLKLGTKSVVGTFTFTVPNEVVEVKIYAAKYKTNTTKITVNGTAYTLANNSDAGAYDEIIVDTTSNKNVTFTTVSGGARCMINTIIFCAEELVELDAVANPSATIDGTNVSWSPVANAAGYNVGLFDNVDSTSPIETPYATENTSYAIDYKPQGTYYVKVKALGDGLTYADSEWVTAGTLVNDEYETKTLAEFLSLPTDTTNNKVFYEITGVISGFYTKVGDSYQKVSENNYDSSYNNASYYISDGTTEVLCYRTGGTQGENLTVGYTVTLRGCVSKYNDVNQLAEGSYVNVQAPADTSAKDAVDLVDAFMSLGYAYTVDTQMVSDTVSATISFASAEQRTSYSTEKQVWQQNGITVTNDKKTGSNIGDYTNPARFYKNSDLIISYTSNILTIIFTYSGGSDYSIEASLKSNGYDFTASGKVYTVNLDEPANSITLTNLANQVRLASIEVIAEGSGTVEKEVFTNVDFRLRLGVDKTLADIENIDAYGIKVSTTSKSKEYLSDNEFFVTDEKCLYVTISLGDVLTNSSRLTEEFTVQAYVVVDGIRYYSKLSKTYSIASLIEEYYEVEGIDAVEPLYDLIVSMGKMN